MTKRAFILTECGETIGYGHVMRCKSLAEELSLKGFEVMFLINGSVRDGILDNYKILNWLDTDYRFLTDSICIVDSYLASGRSYDNIGSYGRLAVIDDNNRLNYKNGIIINPSLFGDSLDYIKNKDCKYLLGSEYVILRKPFRKRFEKLISKEITSVTVTMGGTDVLNLTPAIVDAVRHSLPSVFINAVTANPSAVNESENIKFFSNLNADEMIDVLIRSDIVISAGGQTCNELVQLNTPSILVRAAENQLNNINAMVKHGFSLELDRNNIKGGIKNLITALDYDMRYRMYSEMIKLDYSNGVGNIIKEIC